MPCYHPLTAWRNRLSGEVKFHDKGDGEEMQLPCGRCIGCRLERSRQWATRIMFEAQMHKETSFLTLTYAPEHLPYPPSLNYRDHQGFMKRLRFHLNVKEFDFRKVRFYMCGEYGEQTRRPHFHTCLFGHDFSHDRYFWKNSGSGHPLYRSETLESLWGFGDCYIGDLTFESAAYVARYVLKKVTGQAAEQHYGFLDELTGEVVQLTREFCKMSLKPGIGGRWFELYSNDVYGAGDYVVVNGRKCKPPRYFDKMLRRAAPDLFQDIKDEREYAAYLARSENTDSRLAAREKVQQAALLQLSPRGDL